MASRSERLRATKPETWAALPPTLRAARTSARRTIDRVLLRMASRSTYARLAMIGVPLALAAVLMAGWWFLAPVLVGCAWWWAPSSSGWEWLEATGRGIVATEWGYIGAGALAAFPTERLPVGLVWIAMPLALAACTGRAPSARS